MHSRPLVAVRPPEYWPRIAFMGLVDAADRVVLGDTMQYSRQSFHNRTLVRTPQGRMWLSVPLEAGQHGEAIRDTAIRSGGTWMRKHWRALHYNYRTTPFFDYYEPYLKPLFEREWCRLGELTCATVRLLADRLGIETPIERASQDSGSPSSLDAIVASLASGLLSGAETAAADLRLTSVEAVVHVDAFEYRQNFEGFVGGLSALDLLFNYGPDALSMIRRAARIEPRARGGT